MHLLFYLGPRYKFGENCLQSTQRQQHTLRHPFFIPTFLFQDTLKRMYTLNTQRHNVYEHNTVESKKVFLRAVVKYSCKESVVVSNMLLLRKTVRQAS